jgi:hypothetical protein
LLKFGFIFSIIAPELLWGAKGLIIMRKVFLTFLILAAASPCFAKYSGGTGESNTPYQIANVADLMTLANDANDYKRNFIMTADIDLDPCLAGNHVFTTAVIAPDMDNTNSDFDGFAFTGVFDGAGHQVTNLTINTAVENDYLGLFGAVSGGQIKNLQMKNVEITGSDSSECIGGLAGYNDGNICTCSSTGTVTVGYTGYYIGGLSGWNNDTISNCYSACIVTGGYVANYIGGLVGDNWNGNISNCFSTGAVNSGDNATSVGGLAGDNEDGNISNSYSTGIVTSGYAAYYIGGFVGDNLNGTISNCFSTGDVKSGDESIDVGGLAGNNESGNISESYSSCIVTCGYATCFIGGLAGGNRNGTISNCFSTGAVIGDDDSLYVGGLSGDNNGGNINKCYSAGNVTGGNASEFVGGLVGDNYNDGSISSCYFLNMSEPLNELGKPLTDTQMKLKASFIDWDFVGETANGYYDIWRLCNEGLEYPKLSWQYLPADIACPDGVAFEDLAELCSQWLFEEIPADASPTSGDGRVDFADFVLFANQWGITNGVKELYDFTEQWLKTGLPVCWADLSSDGQVNLADFTLMASDWLQGF